ncbi:cupin-like domain-containing protein [Undibacterium sp. RTI2.1]|uniref:cupin-like domain-containing protein n=1 Tax=unclassified Undibacterium TaxID=2630295 RepID=UPI002AB4E625|nr:MULTISPECIES: cupin-like domain-containing protein [unclassified Undibacterium]MDY7538555.1 cupin-like domain-containing protein [Undibacterium sp. 5I1]MEB0031245.1 cupin-like domain-containing protein [Undibacterium sp. RTI2.1]MEB0116363.1 cupin-like domain-containing protein [Undibacterium sp. RTI2.2]MEB0233170.1 cupin-like domain-containing protein [Undibacterium sp. 10I3]MEB0258977.1 cupin-like domain-containing protein [Undibacterium sp. 5I1]
MSNLELKPLREFHHLDETTFLRDVIGAHQPCVLRGFVKHWPSAQQASAEATYRYLKNLDNGAAVDVILTPPQEDGRIFYNETLDGFNFLRNKLSISAVLDQIMRYSQFDQAPSLAIQSALIAECLPGFLVDNVLPFMSEQIAPRIWLGNKVTTPAHIDTSYNIACVVSGKRRFTIFPPDQVGNLYIGPLDFAPTNSPISLVSFKQPDFQQFPRFKQALEHALVAELEPGDAVYIPTLWWHHVESLSKFNVLINYWWGGSIRTEQAPSTPFECLVHCLTNLKQLPPDQRAAWGALFQHYVFSQDDPAAHIPSHRRGVMDGRTE